MALDSTQLLTLKDEWTLDPLGLGLIGGSNETIASILNTEGTASVENWITADTPKWISVFEFLVTLSAASIANIYDLIVSPTTTLGKVLRLIIKYGVSLDMTHDRIRTDLIEALVTALTITAAEGDALKRLGEVLQSRAEELFGVKITADDVEASRSV